MVNMSSAPSDVDVLIVGAGPAGRESLSPLVRRMRTDPL